LRVIVAGQVEEDLDGAGEPRYRLARLIAGCQLEGVEEFRS
jgi:hypothetical protein